MDMVALWVGRVLLWGGLVFGLLWLIEDLCGRLFNYITGKLFIWKYCFLFCYHRAAFFKWYKERQRLKRLDHQAFRDLRAKIWVGALVFIKDEHLEDWEKKKLSNQRAQVFGIENDKAVIQFKLTAHAATVRTVPISWLETQAF